MVLKENRIMMVSDEMGDIPAGNTTGLGLYFSDTRFLSAYEFRLSRLQPILLSASVDESYVATFQMVNPVLLLDEGKRRIPQQSLSIRRSRFIYGGLHERIGVQNCGHEPVDIECSLRLDADFRDMFDVRGYKDQYRGTIRPLEAGDREQALRLLEQHRDRSETFLTVLVGEAPAATAVASSATATT